VGSANIRGGESDEPALQGRVPSTTSGQQHFHVPSTRLGEQFWRLSTSKLEAVPGITAANAPGIEDRVLKITAGSAKILGTESEEPALHLSPPSTRSG
jgi:hypothetical protein